MNWGCICFDLDNTLLDYEAAFEKGMKHTFNHFFEGEWSAKKRVEVHEWYPVFKKLCNKLWYDVRMYKCTKNEYRQNRFIQSMEHFGIHADVKMAAAFQHYFYSVVHRFVIPITDVHILLNELQERNITIGIISNGAKSIQYKKIKRIGLDRWFSENNVFISEEYQVGKPKPRIFHIAKQKLNNTALPSLYIGDSWELDIVGSVNAGWDAIYFNTRNEKPTTNHQPLEICYTIKEIKKILRL